MSEEEIIGKQIKSLLGDEYTLSRFIKDAQQGLKARRKSREKARTYWSQKKEGDSSEPVASEEPVPQEPEKEKPVAQESEKPRRPSFINLAELQAKFHQGLNENPQLLKIPTLITITKKS